MQSYLELEQLFSEIKNLTNIESMLSWDSAAMMPGGGAEARIDQITALAKIIHGKEVNPKIGELLANSKVEILSDWQQANLQEMARRYIHATSLPSDLAEAVTKASVECELLWRTARAENDFKKITPSFKELLNLVRQVAQVKGEKLEILPYDALLDAYDPGRKSAEVDLIFAQLGDFLKDFIPQATEKQKHLPKIVELRPPFCVVSQKKLGLDIMQMMGFDFHHGRLDISHHPFCGGTHRDVRITTRYNENEFMSALEGIIHETGHALYEQHLPHEYTNQPVGCAMGMSIHESESLIMEMQVGRSLEFMRYLQPKIAAVFGETREDLSAENLYRVVTKVQPSLIRVDADEVTYPAHVIFRYKLEKAMIEGKLEVEDLPAAWEAEIQALLGVKPNTDKDGCMQDIHWYSGAFGYFPTYAFGAITAAQLFNTAKRAHPGLLSEIAAGNLKTLIAWLDSNVYSYGSKFRANELIKQATGKFIGVEDYIANLQKRYLG